VNTSNFGRSAVGLCVAVAVLAGCGREQPLVAPGAISPNDTRPMGAFRVPFEGERLGSFSVSPSALPLPKGAHASDSKASGPLLYVTNYTADYNDVKVYDAAAKDPSPMEVISADLSGPAGDCIDRDGTLYVANEPAGVGWVTEFPGGKAKPSKIIEKGINTPAFCAIDGNGNLWVTNIGGQNVTEYEKGSAKPHTIITKGLFYPDGIAIDRSGNMYVANHYTQGTKGFAPGNVVVYPAGGKSPKRTITDGVASPVGIAVDANGTLYVTNNTENNVAEYLYGKSQPYQTITEGVNGPGGVTVNKAGWLYVANLGNNVVIEFPPNSLKPSRRQISKGLYSPLGAAYFPPLLPKN
jgi:sugar lactone lactonase YvrE